MATWEQAALLDDDLRPTIPDPRRAAVARTRAEIDAHRERMAEAEGSLQEPPAGGVPPSTSMQWLRDEMSRPIEPREDEDDFDTSYVANIAGSSPLSRILDQQERITRIGTGYQFKGLLDGVLAHNASTFAGVSTSLTAGVLPRMRAWEPLVDMTSHVGADARLHAMGTASLASVPSAGTTAVKMFQQLAPTSPAFSSLLTTADLARKTIAETSGLVGAVSSARAMFEAISPGPAAQVLLDGIAESTGLSTTVRAFTEGIAARLTPAVDMSSWATGLSAPAALARLEQARFDSLRQEVMEAWAHASPGLNVDVDALLGRFAPSRNVPPGAWEAVDEDDLAAALTADVDRSLTDPDPQTLQRVLTAEENQHFLDAHFHPFISLDETLKALGFDARARERMAPVLATTAGALAFVMFMLDHLAGGHVKALKEAKDAASASHKRVGDWARGN